MTTGGRLVIYHTSDIHARSAFGERLRAIVEPDAVLVDCGDALAGSSVWYLGDERVARELSLAPYRAMAVGNREFHYLHRAFAARARALPPLVCSNLIDLRGREPIFARQLEVEASGVQLRVLSALVPQYRTGSGWERLFGWRFLAPAQALADILSPDRSLGGAGVKQGGPIILLSHLGLGADREIAAQFPQLAAIFGGHSHERLEEPEIINGVPIAHPGAYAAAVGRMELAIADGSAKMISYRLLPLLGEDA